MKQISEVSDDIASIVQKGEGTCFGSQLVTKSPGWHWTAAVPLALGCELQIVPFTAPALKRSLLNERTSEFYFSVFAGVNSSSTCYRYIGR